MEVGTTLVGLVIVLIGVIPFALMSINRKKRKQKLMQGLSEMAEKNNWIISRYELWNHSAIALMIQPEP
jgi:hypothetical protein